MFRLASRTRRATILELLLSKIVPSLFVCIFSLIAVVSNIEFCQAAESLAKKDDAVKKSESQDKNPEKAPQMKPTPKPSAIPSLTAANFLQSNPGNEVKCEIIEGLPNKGWEIPNVKPALEYNWPAMAFGGAPKKYDAKGLIIARESTYLLRAAMKKELAPGKYRVLLRTRGATRLYVDDKLVAETKFRRQGDSGDANPFTDIPPIEKGLAQLPVDNQEVLALVDLTVPNSIKVNSGKRTPVTTNSKSHVFIVEAIIGDQNMRQELGELVVAIAPADAKSASPYEPTLRILGPGKQPTLSDANWIQYLNADRERVAKLDTDLRRKGQSAEIAHWKSRHDSAREIWKKKFKNFASLNQSDANSEAAKSNRADEILKASFAKIDAEAKSEKKRDFALLTNDLAFLRRVALDTVGVPPSAAELKIFLDSPTATRRASAIDRFINDPRFADHWVSYWQDVLAENPGLVKPQLNNTGPFRYFLYDALADNKPFDRIATELIMMEGHPKYGGPAGFEIATENDAPYAEKAHVISKAFLGVDLKCARCHDAPYHTYKQSDTFQIAAMLARKEQSLPKSSSVPVEPGGRVPLVKISLKPGVKLAARWPFESIITEKVASRLLPQKPAKIVRNTSVKKESVAANNSPKSEIAKDGVDTRALLAALFTSPENERFVNVTVNRVWTRLVGWGLSDSSEDWEHATVYHPELLNYLSYEFVQSGYDLRHLSRMIMRSRIYQSESVAPIETKGSLKEIAAIGPARRRMTAEQIVDSIFATMDRPLAVEELTFDPAGRNNVRSFANMGSPTRAWQFVSLSNERDRPALAIPGAQGVVDVLLAFGWRDSRQNPTTVRDDSPNPLQPLVLANGAAVNRALTMSDANAITQLALANTSLDAFINKVFVQTMTRHATESEISRYRELLQEGFADRINREKSDAPPYIQPRTVVEWSGHHDSKATEKKIEMERAARNGEPPTTKLHAAWRERAEDMLWSIVNSPEFMFVP